MEQLFAAVRRACSPRTWSRGVELARAGAVQSRSAPGDRARVAGVSEISLAVSVPARAASPSVTLWPEPGEWSCDCDSPVDPCEHVAAAVIAVRGARVAPVSEARGPAGAAAGDGDAAQEPPGQRSGSAERAGGRPRAAGRIGYRFCRDGQKLRFERVLVDAAGREEPLVGPLSRRLAERGRGSGTLASAEDLAVDRALGSFSGGWIGRQRMIALLGALSGCDEVTLDGERVSVDGEGAELRALVDDDRDGGFRLHVGHVEDVGEVFENGAALRCGTLRPVAEVPLSRAELQTLRRGRRFGAAEAAELVTRVLPALEARLPVVVRTARLPQTGRLRPQLGLCAEAGENGQLLTIWPVVVYGDPPRAMVRGGELIALDHAAPLPLRDELAEQRLALRAQQELGLRSDRPGHFRGFEAFSEAARLRAGFEGPVLGDGLAAFAPVAGSLAPRLEIDAERWELAFASPDAVADPLQVLAAWQRGESHVGLAGAAGWARLPVDWLERFGHQAAALVAARDGQARLPRAARLDLLRLLDALEQPAPAELEGLRALLVDRPGAAGGATADAAAVIPPAALPDDLVGRLRDYQRHGVDWLVFLRRAGLGALLADDMGLGKTLQALCAVQGRTLVVAPTSVLHGWAAEIERFRPRLSHAIYHGPERALDPGAAVTLTSYAILRQDAERLAAERWDSLVLDESQTIKNPDSQVARAAFALQAEFRLALTGTPVENRLQDLWSQFHLINPGLLGGCRDFDQRYAQPIVAGDARVATELRRRIRPFVLRRLKREVAAELPPRTDVVLRCQLGQAERTLYEAVAATTREQVLRALSVGGSVLNALEGLLRLRQAACHPRLLPGGPHPGCDGSSAKLALLVELLEALVAAEHRALVFSQWTSLLDLVEPALEAAGIDFARLDGSTPAVERARIVDRFGDEAGPPVLLLSLKAGGVGLNLPAADHVLLLDPWWNPSVEDQAADRAHRIGQRRPVVVHHMVAEDTIDERILELQRRKRALAAAALEDAEQLGAAGLTRDDLLYLLER